MLENVLRSGNDSRAERSEESDHGRTPSIFQKRGGDPRTSNATRPDLLEMTMISLRSSLCGGQARFDMAEFHEGFTGVS